VRVLLVVDDSLVQAAVETVLACNTAVEVVAVAMGVCDALPVLREAAVDVVLADLFLRDGTACQLAGRMQQLSSAPPLVVITGFAAGVAATACLEAGAVLCIDKRALHNGVAELLVQVVAGQPWTGAGVVHPDRRSTFTYAEAQVLAHVASGLPDAAIAERLGYSQTYIKKILVTARARLGARDRAHAAAMAATIGLVRPAGPGRFSPALPRRTAHLITSAALADAVHSGVEGRQEGVALLSGGNA
jgi:two-component system NarL family response regulator